MKPEYEAFRAKLLEEMLSRFTLQPNIPYLLKGRCGPWSKRFTEQFPQLRAERGFYNGWEHWWCVDTDGSIVDPTVQQFGVESGDPSHYKILDLEKDEVYLGRCANCGESIYGPAKRGQQGICSDACGDSFSTYLNSEIAAFRR